MNLLPLPVSKARLGYPLSPAPTPPSLPPPAASVSSLPLYVQTARPSQEEAVHAAIVARAVNTLAPRGVKFPRQAGEQEATTWGIPAFTVPPGVTVKQVTCS